MVNDNVHYTVVEKLNGSHASSNALKVTGSIEDLLDGQVAIVEESGVIQEESALADNTTYRVAIGKGGGSIEYSPEFLGKHILAATTADYAAATNKIEKLSFYNIEDNTAYTLNVLIRDTFTTFGNKEMYKFGTFKTGASATGMELAIGLVKSLQNNFKREPEKLIEFTVLSDDAGTAIATDITVVKGSPIVTTGSGQVALNDYVRLGETATGNVYKVVAINSATEAVLDKVVIEASGAITSEKVANNDSVHILFTGLDKTRFDPGLWKFEPTDFNVMVMDNTASVTTSQISFKGTGTWQTVAEEEWFAKGNRGYGTRVDPMLPMPTSKVRTIENEQYEAMSIRYKDQRFTNLVGQSPASIGSFTIYCSDETQASLSTIFGFSNK